MGILEDSKTVPDILRMTNYSAVPYIMTGQTDPYLRGFAEREEDFSNDGQVHSCGIRDTCALSGVWRDEVVFR